MFNELALQQIPAKLQPLCQILQQASQILKSEYQHYLAGDQFHIEHKADASPVTQADLRCNAFIQQQLHALSSLPVLSEEGELQARHAWGDFWLLDPLDGTKEFLNKTGEFCINLSLIEDGVSVISAIAVPMQQRIYIAAQTELPYRCHWLDDDPTLYCCAYQPMARSAGQPDVDLRIALSHRAKAGDYLSFFEHLQQQNIRYSSRVLGSAYKFCLMLEGEIDIYPRFHPTYEWDTAAGQGLLQSIGGNVFDLMARPFRYNQRETLLNRSFIALSRNQDWQLIAQLCNKLLSKN